jgi:hypothetical protein
MRVCTALWIFWVIMPRECYSGRLLPPIKHIDDCPPSEERAMEAAMVRRPARMSTRRQIIKWSLSANRTGGPAGVRISCLPSLQPAAVSEDTGASNQELKVLL